MSNGSDACQLIRFGRYTLDRGRASLTADGKPVVLRPKPFDVLHYLLENADRVVSKDELGEAVWPGIAVSDELLAKSVSEVRLALGAEGSQIIKTVPRRGYLLNVPVINGEAEDETIEHVEPDKRLPDGLVVSASRLNFRNWLGTAWITATLCIVLVIALLLIIFVGGDRKHAADAQPSIAVLPFANEGEPRHQYFSDGIAEDLTTSLGKFSGLYVIGRDFGLRL